MYYLQSETPVFRRILSTKVSIPKGKNKRAYESHISFIIYKAWHSIRSAQEYKQVVIKLTQISTRISWCRRWLSDSYNVWNFTWKENRPNNPIIFNNTSPYKIGHFVCLYLRKKKDNKLKNSFIVLLTRETAAIERDVSLKLKWK